MILSVTPQVSAALTIPLMQVGNSGPRMLSDLLKLPQLAGPGLEPRAV